VTLVGASGARLEGWALNVSRGGLRVILEESVELGAEFEITMSIGDGPGQPSPGAEASGAGSKAAPTLVARVVWVQEEPDGVVAGLEFR
jgi:hypothetical protein